MATCMVCRETKYRTLKGVRGSDEVWEVCQDKSLLLPTLLSVCKSIHKATVWEFIFRVVNKNLKARWWDCG